MNIRRRRRESGNDIASLISSGQARAIQPTTQTGTVAYGTGRVFSADTVLIYPTPAIGNSGTVAYRCVPSWAGTDVSFRYFVALKSADNSTWQAVSGKGNSRYWQLWINDGSHMPSCGSSSTGAELDFAAGSTHSLAMCWDAAALSMNYDGVEATPVANTATLLACGPVDLHYTVSSSRHTSSLGPVIISAEKKSLAWRTAIQANSGAAYTDPMRLFRDFMRKDDILLPLGGDSLGLVKLTESPPFQSNGQVVFDGDSLTTGIGAAAGQDYPTQCLALINQGLTKTNVAANGQTIPGMAADAAAQIDVLYDAARSRNVLVIWGGENDLYGGASAADTITALSGSCTARRAAGWKVVVLTLLPCSYTDTPAGYEAARQAVNTSIRANWATYADRIADIAANTTIGDAGDEENTTYYADRLHMTAAGYAIVAGIVKTAIESLL